MRCEVPLATGLAVHSDHLDLPAASGQSEQLLQHLHQAIQTDVALITTTIIIIIIIIIIIVIIKTIIIIVIIIIVIIITTKIIILVIIIIIFKTLSSS